jgi:type IV pilus assembly protein PilC
MRGKKMAKARKTMKDDHANLFFRQLAAMTASGMTLVEAIRVLAEEGAGSPIGVIVSSIQKEIERGADPGAAITAYIPQVRGLSPSVFTQELGMVSRAFRHMAEFSEKRQVLRRFMILSLIYPAFLITVLFCVLALLMIVVIPMFASMYADMGGELPLPTRIVMALSRHFWVFAWLVPVGIIAFIEMARYKRIWLYAFADKVPVIKTLNRKIAAAEFLRNLSLMANINTLSRETLSDAAAVSNDLYAYKLKASAAGTDGFLQFVDQIGEMRIIPPMVRHTVRAGEKSGTLAAALQETAGFMEQDAEKMYNRFLVFLHPVMIILLGVIVGFCLVALYLPIFQLGAVAS